MLRTLRDGDWRVAAGLPPNPLYTLPTDGTSGSDSDSDSDGQGDVAEQIRGSDEEEVDTRAEGTAAYLPPEVVKGCAPSILADAWALGCVTFLCLAGRPPIFAETDEAIMARIVRFAPIPEDSGGVGKDDGFAALPPNTPPSARSFVYALMKPDVEARLSVENAARHQFLMEDGVDVFCLHRQEPVELARGTVAPMPNAAWSRRQNSMIWAPMPQEYG